MQGNFSIVLQHTIVLQYTIVQYYNTLYCTIYCPLLIFVQNVRKYIELEYDII